MALVNSLASLLLLAFCLAFAYELGKVSGQGLDLSEVSTWLRALWSLVADLAEAAVQLKQD